MINHKRMERLYREEGLALRRKRRRKGAAGVRVVMSTPQMPNERWSMDFVADSIVTERRFRALAGVDDNYRQTVGLKSGGQGHLETAGRFKNNSGRLQTSDVADGISDAFMIIGELSRLLGIADCHVQGTFGNIHTDADRFFCHWHFLLLSPSLHHAGLINPINCSGFIGDSGMATTLTHGLVRPKVNRSATPSLRQTFYHIIRDTRSG